MSTTLDRQADAGAYAAGSTGRPRSADSVPRVVDGVAGALPAAMSACGKPEVRLSSDRTSGGLWGQEGVVSEAWRRLRRGHFFHIEFRRQARRWLSVAVPSSAKASTPVLDGSGKIWSVRTTCPPWPLSA